MVALIATSSSTSSADIGKEKMHKRQKCFEGIYVSAFLLLLIQTFRWFLLLGLFYLPIS